MSCYREILTTCLILSFIFIANGYSILLGLTLPYNCLYHHAKVLTIIILFSSTTYSVIAWVILMRKYIKMGLFYMMLPWIGLVYILTSELLDRKSYGDWDLKSYGALASTGLGLLITICCCYLILFRLLNLAIGSLRQKSVQHPRHRQVEMTSNIQQQQHCDESDDQLMEERSFISQLREGGIMPWRGVKLVIVCIVNGAVMMGSQELVLESNCILSVAAAVVMLIIGLIDFGLFFVRYNLEEGYGEVLPPPPLPPAQV